MKQFENLLLVLILSVGALSGITSCAQLHGPTQVVELDTVSNDLTFSPDSGEALSMVTVFGVGVGRSSSAIKAFFGANETSVISIFPDSLIVDVPSIDTGYYSIRLFIGNDTIRSTPKKFHVFDRADTTMRGITVDIINMSWIAHYYHSGPTEFDSTITGTFHIATSGITYSNTQALFIEGFEAGSDFLTRDSGIAHFGSGSSVIDVSVTNDRLSVDPDVPSRYSSFIGLANLPNFVLQPDGSKLITLTGPAITASISSIGYTNYTYGNSDERSDELKKLIGCATNSVMTIKIKP